MSRFRMTGAAITLGVGLALFAGCTCGCVGTAGSSDEALTASSGGGAPAWAKVVPYSRDGRLLFVGGASFAVSPEAGIEEAGTDARQQVGVAARKRFTDLFNSGIQRSGIETTASERRDYKNKVSARYADAMESAARQDSVYYRFCGDDELAAGADGGEGRPVCAIFVLASVAESDWDGGLVEIFEVEERRRAEEGESALADLTEWYMRKVLEDGAAEGREHQR